MVARRTVGVLAALLCIAQAAPAVPASAAVHPCAVRATPAPGARPAACGVTTDLSAGGRHTCAFHASALFCWGYDGLGAVGAGLAGLDMPPVTPDTSGVLSGVTLRAVTAGANHTCALSNAGLAYCWGDNTHGQLGDGTTTERDSPVAVDTTGVLNGVQLRMIVAGGDHTCALSSSDAVYCWGDNGHGQLGDGTTTERDSPVAVAGGTSMFRISAGAEHTCAVSSTDAAYCWGRGDAGQLGDGGATDRHSPVAVDTGGVLSGVVLDSITAGLTHTCAFSFAAAYCWGGNSTGQLGDGTTTERDSPVAVDMGGALSGASVHEMSAGAHHTCAVSSHDRAYCWGDNHFGQLGDGTTTERDSPVAVDTSGALSGVNLEGIAAGTGHTCVESWARETYCWGSDIDQQLGDGSGTDQHAPGVVRPGPPLGVSASARDSALDVSWLAPLGLYGGTLQHYVATADPGGATCSTTGDTHCVISGLTNGTAYTVSVVAQTTVGDSVPATAEAATPVALPDPPAGVHATAGDGELFVTWTAPAFLGTGTLTGYTATAAPDGASCQSTGDTQCTITGLDNGTEYVVTVVTHTTDGDSEDSDPSDPVTPELPAVTLPAVVPVANGPLHSSAGALFTGSARSTVLTGDGFAAGSPVLIGLYSRPRRLAATTADRSGHFRVRVTIPTGYAGAHTLVAVGLAADHRQRALTLPITITGDGLADTGSPMMVALVVMGLGLVAAGAIGFLSTRRRAAPGC